MSNIMTESLNFQSPVCSDALAGVYAIDAN